MKKIKPLTGRKMHFPLQSDAVTAFESLRKELLNACLKCIDENELFTVECDASDFAIAAVLSQGERPVAFISRTLSKSECNYPTVEKEAASIIEAVQKWGHYLHSRLFTLITDQHSCLTNTTVVKLRIQRFKHSELNWVCLHTKLSIGLGKKMLLLMPYREFVLWLVAPVA